MHAKVQNIPKYSELLGIDDFEQKQGKIAYIAYKQCFIAKFHKPSIPSPTTTVYTDRHYLYS